MCEPETKGDHKKEREKELNKFRTEPLALTNSLSPDFYFSISSFMHVTFTEIKVLERSVGTSCAKLRVRLIFEIRFGQTPPNPSLHC
jgi:hypothetical protein